VKIAVVIPALDEAEAIAEAVRSAVPPQTGNAEIEVWVVDGGSRDGTGDLARAAGARVLDGVRGRARQLEGGFRASRGEVVLFLHADTRLPPGWAEAVRKVLSDPRVVGGAFRLRFRELGWRLRIIEVVVALRVRIFGLPYGDQAIFARRDVLEAVGGVPDVPLMEDLDLVQALKRRGVLARVALPATTSARRHLSDGVGRTLLRHTLALLAWRLGIERRRVAAWYAR